MMKDVKFLEIRDRATFIPVMATQLSKADGYLASRAGFGERPLVYLVHLQEERGTWDPYHWPDRSRTMREAHRWIEEHWDEICDDQVIDVEHILGETGTPKISERLWVPTP